MKTLFEILPAGIEASQSSLLLDINKDGLFIAIKNEVQGLFEAVAILEFDHNMPHKNYATSLEGVLDKHPVLQEDFKNVLVLYSNPEAVLMPFELYRSENNKEILRLIAGDMDMNTSVLTDITTDQGIYTIYRVADNIENVFKSKFPNYRHQHLYTALLKALPPVKDALYAFFYTHKIIIKLNGNGVTQLMNTFEFSTPTDAAYILLNICKQYDFAGIPLEIGGLIEEDSTLYKELYKYFHDIRFSKLPPNCRVSEAISKLPAHYFSPIFAVDICES